MQTELETVQRSDQCITCLALEPKKSPPAHTVFTSLPSTMQCMQVKSTFIHFHLASDEVEGVLRRSSSLPAILKTPWMEEPTSQAAEAWPVTEDEREWTDDEARTEASAEASTEASADTSPVKRCLLEEKLLAHRLGKCKPCGYHYFKVDGCRQGDDCEFCHCSSVYHGKIVHPVLVLPPWYSEESET
ncbi:unnamed protein product [Polarella glacialis]|uniref:C3H1-type domain-containing protein n=1 Tax=Polarella glacialis TaxID=89957 RepID=A0A813ILQ7_POLGL|nr:unnamed protein product [Polarella glacialis]